MKRLTLANRRIVWIVGIMLLSGAAAVATPSFGTAQATLASALYTDIDIDAKRPDWKASLTVKGVSGVFVTSHSIIPGGYSGWHSHPGLSVVSVTQGTLWLYDASDPNCAPTIVTAGHGFVESGDHVHMVRNEGGVEATWTTTAIRPAGSTGRIDQPNPGNCSF